MEHSHVSAEAQDELAGCVVNGEERTCAGAKTPVLAQVSEMLAIVDRDEHTSSDRAEPPTLTSMQAILPLSKASSYRPRMDYRYLPQCIKTCLQHIS